MFVLTIGVNTEHPDVPWDKDFYSRIESMLMDYGLPSTWDHSAITVRWEIKDLYDGLILGKVKEMLLVTGLPQAAIHHIHLWGAGRLNAKTYSSVARSGFYIGHVPHTGESYVSVYPRACDEIDFDLLISAFERVVSWFAFLISILQAHQEVRRMIKDQHNYPAALSKLTRLSRRVAEAGVDLKSVWEDASVIAWKELDSTGEKNS